MLLQIMCWYYLSNMRNIALSPITWTVVPLMLCIFFRAKHVQSNTQVVLKASTLDFFNENTVKQASFHAHFEDDKHHGMSDWEITLIDQTKSVDNLRRKESFWQYQLNTFQPNRLNECNLALFWCAYLLKFYNVFIFTAMTHYIYCNTLISTLTLRVLIILLFTLLSLLLILLLLLSLLPVLFYFIYLFHLKFICLLIYLFIY